MGMGVSLVPDTSEFLSREKGLSWLQTRASWPVGGQGQCRLSCPKGRWQGTWNWLSGVGGERGFLEGLEVS